MSDRFKNAPGLASPAAWAFDIGADDNADLPTVTRGLYVGTAGDVTVLFRNDDTPVTLRGLVAGMIYPIRIKRVYATGLTAGNLVGLS